jgi:hypothetical protein
MSEDQTNSVAAPEQPAPVEQPPAGAPPEPPEQPPTEPYATFPDAESFQKRVEREARKTLKDMGITDPAQVKSILEEHASLKTAAEEAERAKMSEIERLQADLQTSKSRTEEIELQYEELRVRNHLSSVFAKKGIRNFDYGFFLINKKLDELGEDDELDEEAFLDELAQDPTARAALGMEPANGGSAPQPPTQPVTTSPQVPKAPSPPNSSSLPAKTAMDMSPDEWAQYKQRMGLST